MKTTKTSQTQTTTNGSTNTIITAHNQLRKSNSSVLSEESVLASQFVPQHLKIVNSWNVSATFSAAGIISSDENDDDNNKVHSHPGRKSWTPHILICCCGDATKTSNGNGPDNSLRTVHSSYPIRKVPSDLYWATRTTTTTKPIPTTNTKDENTANTTTNPQVCSAESISTLQDYKTTWESILQIERMEILKRYEQYSQYAHPIYIPSHVSMYAIDSSGSTGTTTISMGIAGIADANPPLQIGDIVLLRPLHPLSLPIAPTHPYHHQQQQQTSSTPVYIPEIPQNHPVWSPPAHVTEIQVRVLSVRRSNPLDTVILTWLHPKTWNLLHHTLSTAKSFHQRHHHHQHHHKQRSKTKLPNVHSATSISSASSSYSDSPPDVWEFNVRFVPSNTQYKRCLTALDWLVHSFHDQPARAMEFLFPTHAPYIQVHARNNDSTNGSILEWTRDLNHQQADFVRMVLHRTQNPSTDAIRGPMVLTGCAGTGKTKTMLAAVHAILRLPPENPPSQYRILVCAPSHTAADVITKRLGQSFNAQQLFRLFDSERPVETVPPEVLKYCRQSTEDHTGTFTLPPVKELLQFQIIVCTCSDAHILYRIGMTNQQLREQRQCFQRYLERFCRDTNLSCTLQGVEDPHFTHLFIDEAAQSSEVETLIPFSVVVDQVAPGPRKVEIALVGDPRQLSPEVYSAQAAKAGLEKSFMERLLQRPVQCLGYGRDHMLGPDMVGMEDWLRYSFQHHGQEQLSVFLTSNYRGHVSFLMMPSALFYSDKLQSVDHDKRDGKGETYWSEKLRWVESLSNPLVPQSKLIQDVPEEVRCRKQYAWPLHFRGVAGKDASVTIQSGFASRSWTNETEAKTIVEIVETLSKQGVSSRSIGIMAPFRGQVVLIRKLLRAKNLGAINVGTIEDYQAVEYDVIILSCTRSTEAFVAHDSEHRMGILGQPKRSNVALTRAQYLFIVVGHPDVLIKDIVWRHFLLFCFRNGFYYGVSPSHASKYLEWNKSSKLVRCLPTISTRVEEDETFVTVGTLERLLRNA
jgi:hypothetical protein